MKIYFAGSIRGGRQDAARYGHIIELLKRHGQVLTQHVGETDPDDAEEGLSDEDIYKRDMTWLEEADTLVAEVTVPSHGVGYEIARAEALAKPTLCIYRTGQRRRLSALIAGNPSLRCESYQRVRELDIILASFLRRQKNPTRRRQ
ncbi:MAG: nucleoside 2-deoxyribosyltransferase [Anaerolineae bacterium]|jgi:nucleoside 2-deoxyribosyltransferase